MTSSTTPAAPSSVSSRAGMVMTLLAATIWCVVVHLLVVDHTMPSLTLLVITAPWLLAGASAVAGAARARAIGRVPAVVGIAAGLALSAGLVWQLGRRLDGRVDWAIFAESLVFLLSLAMLFAGSLFGDREALVTRLARIARQGDMTPAVVRYTRRVTAGWASFFTLAAALSVLLFTTQSRDLWSAFVNLGLWPLTAVAFAIEYGIRVRVLPDIDHGSPLVGVRTFMHRDAVGGEPAHGERR